MNKRPQPRVLGSVPGRESQVFWNNDNEAIVIGDSMLDLVCHDTKGKAFTILTLTVGGDTVLVDERLSGKSNMDCDEYRAAHFGVINFKENPYVVLQVGRTDCANRFGFGELEGGDIGGRVFTAIFPTPEDGSCDFIAAEHCSIELMSLDEGIRVRLNTYNPGEDRSMTDTKLVQNFYRDASEDPRRRSDELPPALDLEGLDLSFLS